MQHHRTSPTLLNQNLQNSWVIHIHITYLRKTWSGWGSSKPVVISGQMPTPKPGDKFLNFLSLRCGLGKTCLSNSNETKHYANSSPWVVVQVSLIIYHGFLLKSMDEDRQDNLPLFWSQPSGVLPVNASLWQRVGAGLRRKGLPQFRQVLRCRPINFHSFIWFYL